MLIVCAFQQRHRFAQSPRCVSPPGEIPEVEQDAADKWEMVDFEELVTRTCMAAGKIC
jgi:hypothetical protein